MEKATILREIHENTFSSALNSEEKTGAGEERSISNNNDSYKIMGLSGEEFYIGVVIASSASPAVHSRRQWGWLVGCCISILLFYFRIRSVRKVGWRWCGDDEKSTKLCQECAISERNIILCVACFYIASSLELN